MTIAVILIPVVVVAFVAVYRNQRDTAHLGRVPFGAGSAQGRGPDAQRIHDELTVLTSWTR